MKRLSTVLEKATVLLEGNTKVLYHTTLTKNKGSIEKKGLMLLQPTNWTTGTGARYGDGSLFAFEHIDDAIRWAGRMDWAFNKAMGTGKVSIVKFVSDPELWVVDTADPISQAGRKGDWLKASTGINPTQIKSIVPVTTDMIRKIVQ